MRFHLPHVDWGTSRSVFPHRVNFGSCGLLAAWSCELLLGLAALLAHAAASQEIYVAMAVLVREICTQLTRIRRAADFREVFRDFYNRKTREFSAQACKAVRSSLSEDRPPRWSRKFSGPIQRFAGIA